jgi:hypothetical protein
MSGCATSITGATVSVGTNGGLICVASARGVTVTPGCDSSTPSTTSSARGVMATPDHTTSPMGTPCVPSLVCPSVDVAVATSGTPQMGVVAILAPLPLSAAPADPSRVDRRTRIFLGATCRGTPCPLALPKGYNGQIMMKFDKKHRNEGVIDSPQCHWMMTFWGWLARPRLRLVDTWPLRALPLLRGLIQCVKREGSS